MIKNLVFVFLSGIVLFFAPSFLSAQVGSVKVFSEISGTQVYLDDELKGSDLNLIESVPTGSHYLKVTVDQVIIYGELIAVKENEVTTILIKDTQEIRDKILGSKYQQIEKYKEQKLDVLISTKYVTQTTGTSETQGAAVNWFPGYYSVAGKTESTTISTTYSQSDWFMVQGTTAITEKRFAELTGMQWVLDRYAQREVEVKELNHKGDVKSRVLAFFVGPSLGGLGAFILMKGLDAEKGSVGNIMGIIWGGTFAGLGAGLTISAIVVKTEKWGADKHSVPLDMNVISFSEAEKQVKIYNQNLKKQLGLPIDFEPVE